MIKLAQKQKWAIGYQDECWWSKLAQPKMHNWQVGQKPTRLEQKEAGAEKGDQEPKAICCYGMSVEGTGQMLLRFVEGQATSLTTIKYLEWISEKLTKGAGAGEAGVVVMVWDNASWHKSKMVKEWLRQHNRQARGLKKAGQGWLVIIPCYLPSRSPWLNPIEPRWVHGKRAVVEPARKLSAPELVGRICAYFKCENLPHISNQLP